ncbi:MAG: MATE family efflux transporter [Candidatus Rifleibacteriota bacterium]
MKQTSELENLPISRLLLKFSLPAMAGTIVTSLYNIVDRIFLGRFVGEVGIAATTVSMPMMMIIMAFGMLVGFGTNSQISIKLGEKKQDEAEELLGQGFLLFLLTSLALTSVGLFLLDDLLILFGATEKILPYARPYLGIVLLGVLPNQISFGVNSFIRGEGNPRIAMATMLIGGVLNVIFDYIFIAMFGWGMEGAAWATVLGYSISAAWVLYYYLSGNSEVKLYLRNFTMKLASVWQVMVMGSPHFIMSVITSVQMSIFNNQLSVYGGELAISVMGVLMSFNFIWLMPVIGISQGLQPIVGYNYGACRPDRVKKALYRAILVAIAMCTFFFAVIMLFPEYIFMLFTSDNRSDFVALGADAIKKFLCVLPLIGYLIITGNYFQFTGRPKISLALTIFRQVVFLIPMLLIFPVYMGLDGIWYAMPGSDLGALALTTFFFLRERKQLKRMEAFNRID